MAGHFLLLGYLKLFLLRVWIWWVLLVWILSFGSNTFYERKMLEDHPEFSFQLIILRHLHFPLFITVIKRPSVKKLLSLPEIVQQPPTTQPSFSLFGGSNSLFGGSKSLFGESKSTTPAVSPPSIEQSKLPDKKIISSSSVISQRLGRLEKSVKARKKNKKRWDCSVKSLAVGFDLSFPIYQISAVGLECLVDWKHFRLKSSFSEYVRLGISFQVILDRMLWFRSQNYINWEADVTVKGGVGTVVFR